MKYETVGRVLEIWRYPVKSMRGESLQVADIDSLGLNGDRGWAVKDNNSGEIKGAKRFPDLMQCSAKYLSEPGAIYVFQSIFLGGIFFGFLNRPPLRPLPPLPP